MYYNYYVIEYGSKYCNVPSQSVVGDPDLIPRHPMTVYIIKWSKGKVRGLYCLIETPFLIISDTLVCVDVKFTFGV